MTINITSGSSGWGNYVLYGTKEVPRDTSKVEFLEGDIALGDRLSQSNNYEESYYKIVLAFEGKPSDEVLKSAYEDFKKEMFVGFKPDEYHIDAVIHKDTDNYHIHCRVPKQNLKTDTHLQLYMDKIDRPRKELIQDYISLKYGFNIARETNREVFKEQSHEHINKWRKEHNQKPFDFSNKKGQAEAEAQINGYLSEFVKSGLIEKREDISTTLKELGLKIEKENGLDIKKDFAYTTVSNETGKLRIKGEIHHDRFYEHNQKDRSSQIDNNRRIKPDRESIEGRAKQVQRDLRGANERRFNKVTELFKVARARAEAEHSKTLEIGRLESINSNKSIKHNNRVIDRNTNTKTSRAEPTGNAVAKQNNDGHRWKKISEIQPKRVNTRPTETNLLLQDKIKERANERLINEAIDRIRREREAQQTALQRARSSRENNNGIITKISETNKREHSLSESAYDTNREDQSRIRRIGITIQNVITRIREKALKVLKDTQEKIKEKVRIFDPLFEKGMEKEEENLSKLVQNMEKRPKSNTEKLEIHRQKVRETDKIKEAEKTTIKQEPTTHKRSRSRGFSR